MPFPTVGWPPPPCSGRRSIRFYKEGTTTANFSDNAFLFIDEPGANTFTPLPDVPPGSNAPVVVPKQPGGTGPSSDGEKAAIFSTTIRIWNDGANKLEISFDGNVVHGSVAGGKEHIYRQRHEAGISVRFPGGGGASAFRIEAW